MLGADQIMRHWYPGKPSRSVRQFQATDELIADLEKGFWMPRAGETRERLSRCRWELFALVKDWCDGEYIRPGGDLKPLDPWRGNRRCQAFEGLWEFRTSMHRPKSRLLGVIPERNAFVALGLYRRDSLKSGVRGHWEAAAEHVQRRWSFVGSGRSALRFRGAELEEEDAREFWDE